jgi:hypothetical protein
MIGVFLLSSFLEVVCCNAFMFLFTPLVQSYFVGLLFFGVCGVLLAFVTAGAILKVQMYEMSPLFRREFVSLRRQDQAVEGIWVGLTIH